MPVSSTGAAFFVAEVSASSRVCVYTGLVRLRDSPRKVVLPDGELRRFQLPERLEDAPMPPTRRRVRGWGVAFLVWLLLSLLCFQWSEGRVTLRSWVEPVVEWWQRGEQETTDSPPLPGLRSAANPHVDAPNRSDLARSTAPEAQLGSPATPPPEVPRLPAHQGAFFLSGETEEEPFEEGVSRSSSVKSNVTTQYDGSVVHAGPGCEGARKRFAEAELDEVPHAELAELLGRRSVYAHCRVPDLMIVELCATVQEGRAVGVTVRTEPPNRRVALCAAIAAKMLHYPRFPRPQLVRSNAYFR